MRLPQIHATTVLHPINKKLSWQFLVVPAHSVSDLGLSIDLSLIERLQLRKIRDIEPSLLPFLVASMLGSEGSAQILKTAQSYAQAWPWTRESLSNEAVEALEFAEQVVFRELVPFERSPLAQESFASITSSTLDERENTGGRLG